MNINVSDNVYMKSDSPKIGDFFVVARKNGHQTAYMIASNGFGSVQLVNMNSGASGNYRGTSIQETIVNFFEVYEKEKIKTNPITGYFFVKSYESKLSVERTFGYKNMEDDV